jgi:hypothetical protein
VIVHGYREHFFCLILAYHVFIEVALDFLGVWHFVEEFVGENIVFLIEDLFTYVDAFVADVDPRTGDETTGGVAGLPAERTGLDAFGLFTHISYSASSLTNTLSTRP